MFLLNVVVSDNKLAPALKAIAKVGVYSVETKALEDDAKAASPDTGKPALPDKKKTKRMVNNHDPVKRGEKSKAYKILLGKVQEHKKGEILAGKDFVTALSRHGYAKGMPYYIFNIMTKDGLLKKVGGQYEVL